MVARWEEESQQESNWQKKNNSDEYIHNIYYEII